MFTTLLDSANNIPFFIIPNCHRIAHSHSSTHHHFPFFMPRGDVFGRSALDEMAKMSMLRLVNQVDIYSAPCFFWSICAGQTLLNLTRFIKISTTLVSLNKFITKINSTIYLIILIIYIININIFMYIFSQKLNMFNSSKNDNDS